VLAFYIGAVTYGYIYIGLEDLLPAYLVMLSSIIILFFSIFKAGSVIFQKNAYDELASLPITQTAIVISRFIRMYIENLILIFVVMVPAMVVYGVMIKPSVSFYAIGFIVTLFIPFIPITLAVFVGALITAVVSKMRNKSIVSAILSILLVVGVLVGMSQMTGMEEDFSIEAIKDISHVATKIIGAIYPPAVWLGDAMQSGDFITCLACVTGGMVLLGLVVALVSANFHRISRGLYSTNAKHIYKMTSLKTGSVLNALYRREVKRYFSSSVYVMNTIVGPILSVVFAVVILVMGIDKIEGFAQIPIDIKGFVPFLLAGIYCIMPTTSASISMEGKEWWIVKSLPVKTKTLLDSKLLLQLSLILPFYLVSEVIFIIALKPQIVELIWLMITPVVMVLFSSVFGLFINLKLPTFNWENEVQVVKQSASAFIGGVGGFLVVLLMMVPVILVPTEYCDIIKILEFSMLLILTAWIYRVNNRVKLEEL